MKAFEIKQHEQTTVILYILRGKKMRESDLPWWYVLRRCLSQKSRSFLDIKPPFSVQLTWKDGPVLVPQRLLWSPLSPAIGGLSFLNHNRSLGFPSWLCFFLNISLLISSVVLKNRKSRFCSHHLHIYFSARRPRNVLFVDLFCLSLVLYLSCQLIHYHGWDHIAFALC